MLDKGQFFSLFQITFVLPCEKWVNITNNMENIEFLYFSFSFGQWTELGHFVFFWERGPTVQENV